MPVALAAEQAVAVTVAAEEAVDVRLKGFSFSGKLYSEFMEASILV